MKKNMKKCESNQNNSEKDERKDKKSIHSIIFP